MKSRRFISIFLCLTLLLTLLAPAALAVNGEGLTSATATVTPAAVENYFNIYVSAQVSVPKGCCLTVAMKNTSTQAVNFANSNLTVERIA